MKRKLNFDEPIQQATQGRIYIAAMNLRGTWAKKPEGVISLNVTSAQNTASHARRDFSPMTAVDGGYKGYYNFEAYWQSGKVFEGFSETKVKAWWKRVKKPKRRYPGSKGIKVLGAKFEDSTVLLDYVTSRKQVYVPEYYNLVKDRPSVAKWKAVLDGGGDVVVYDFDGPRNEKGEPVCIEVDLALLKTKIEELRHPFGHGYVVAGMLAGLTPKDYC